jgi:hypothetical protein
VLVVGQLKADGNELKQQLDDLIDNIPNLATVRSALEARGLSVAWLTSGNTLRDALRYVLRVFVLSQVGDSNLIDLIKRNLDTTVSQVPLGIRNGVRAWMEARGLSVGWITSQTTVRQILHYIVTNLGIGKVRLANEEF